jgi:hypothetical protein
MKTPSHGFAQKLRKVLRSVVRTHLINRNGCVAGDLARRQGARRENILHGSLSDEQRRRRAKDPGTRRADLWRAAGRVAPQLQSAMAMLFRRALPAARHSSAHLVPIYEMGSKESNYRHIPLLINSLAAFNFRPPLEFPGELLSRYREFAQ